MADDFIRYIKDWVEGSDIPSIRQNHSTQFYDRILEGEKYPVLYRYVYKSSKHDPIVGKDVGDKFIYDLASTTTSNPSQAWDEWFDDGMNVVKFKNSKGISTSDYDANQFSWEKEVIIFGAYVVTSIVERKTRNKVPYTLYTVEYVDDDNEQRIARDFLEKSKQIRESREYKATAECPSYEEAKKICRTPKSFISYIRNHKDTYYSNGEFDKVEGALQYITEVIYGKGYWTDGRESVISLDKYFLNMVNDYCDNILALGEDDEIDVYRGLKLESEDAMDWNDLGNCWSYEEDTALEFLQYYTEEYEGDEYMLSATTDRDNVDWILSICLALTHARESELRLIDPSKVYSPYLEKVDDDNLYEAIGVWNRSNVLNESKLEWKYEEK